MEKQWSRISVVKMRKKMRQTLPGSSRVSVRKQVCGKYRWVMSLCHEAPLLACEQEFTLNATRQVLRKGAEERECEDSSNSKLKWCNHVSVAVERALLQQWENPGTYRWPRRVLPAHSGISPSPPMGDLLPVSYKQPQSLYIQEFIINAQNFKYSDV